MGTQKSCPFLKAKLDVVGFWVDSGEEPEYWGANSKPSPHGAANVTWIIRWEAMNHRNQGHKDVFGSSGWQDIWGGHPDTNGYLHSEIVFVEEI